jgi:Uma2 family endonuclease
MAMGEAAPRPWIGYAAYLDIERESGRRHEWLDGQVYAMAGGSLSHSALAVAVAAELRSLSRASGYQVFSSDAKVRVIATGLATYPDVSVVCGPIERDREDPNAITNPSVLVEVLSASTEGYDRGAKFAHFRELPSLRDYVLVSQHERRIEVYSRDAQGLWVLREARAGGEVPLSALGGATLVIDHVYEGVELEPRPARSTG